MPSRYPQLYPDLFVGLDASNIQVVLQTIGSTHDGSLRPRADVAEAVERGRQLLRAIEQSRALRGTAPTRMSRIHLTSDASGVPRADDGMPRDAMTVATRGNYASSRPTSSRTA